MLTEHEEKLIQRYYIYPKIAITAVIMALALGVPFILLEMIDDLVFHDEEVIFWGLYVYLGFAALYLILFCYCTLRAKLGILAVSCVTVAFCSNFLMVQDKANGTIRDLRISPVKSATLSLSYYVATLLSTLIICFAAMGICLTYVAIVGWYMSLADIFFLFLDILLLVLFGTALSSIINFFLSTQGQISAVGTIISAGYGFICGAYMPISSFGEGLQKIISFLPGTYGTSLIRNHTMQGALAEMQNQGIPTEVIEKLKDSLDCNLYFFGSQVNIGTMYMILGIAILVFIGIYILLNKSKKYNC